MDSELIVLTAPIYFQLILFITEVEFEFSEFPESE
jgi:hypothetical protein